jgi:hypothetical protein
VRAIVAEGKLLLWHMADRMRGALLLHPASCPGPCLVLRGLHSWMRTVMLASAG